MSPNASFIPPGIAPPDPPEAKTVVFVFSLLMSGLLVVFIGFMSIEFLAELIGHPLNFGTQQPPPVSSFADQVRTERLKSPFELITPKHQTCMFGPEIVVIYTQRVPSRGEKIPDLLIDGLLHPWEVQFGDNTWFARLFLPAGLHRIVVEESEADFFVENLDSPLRSREMWSWNYPHPDTDKINRCNDCHEMTDQPTAASVTERNEAVGVWKGTASCFVCHDEGDHKLRHSSFWSNRSTATQCFRCHAIH